MPKPNSEKTQRSIKSSKRRKIVFTLLFILFGLALLAGWFMWQVYSDVTETSENIYHPVEVEQHRPEPVIVDRQEPFSVLLLGVDTGALGRTEQGRSDTLMVMTVNPNTEETTIVSIPRDTYTEIVGRGEKDKINHAYAFGGTSMAMNSVQNLLDIPIDYYVKVNMQGLQDIVNELGGVTVTSPLTFSYEGHSFEEGVETELNGEEALAYARMRYDDPQGDYGRQARQRQIVEAIIQKTASFSGIRNYRGILDSLEANVQTNLTFDDLVDIFNKYQDAANTIEQVQLQGQGQYIDGIYYEVLNEDKLAEVQSTLKEQLNVE